MSDVSDTPQDGRPDKPDVPKPTAAELEAELAVRRARLASTVDELVTRTQPQALLRRQGDNARLAFIDATRTQDGGLRIERIAAVAAAAVALLVAIGLLRRRRG